MSKKDDKIFHLGLSMAGAVSAGAYTAGFIDYLLEALNSWEVAKNKERNNPTGSIPMHNVMIDAIGGASAGGMVSMITTLAFYSGKIEPVRKVSNTKTGNILYDSWVFLDDDDSLYDGNGLGKTTFEKMLMTDDLDGKIGAPSLLNSKPIDKIAENIFEKLPKNASINNFPKYISKSLRVLLTLTSLRPLDYKIKLSNIKSKFLDFTPGHRISNHDLVAHFKVDYDSTLDKDKFLPFRPLKAELDKSSNQDLLIKTTKATGAFPVGLAPRYFDNDLTMNYVQTDLKRRKNFSSKMDIEFESRNVPNFQFTAVDGGAINNEPFDEVLRCLVSNHGQADVDNPKFGTLLIDPFPNFEDANITKKVNYDKRGMLDIIGALVPTILNQARNKRSDTYATSLFKVMSFPRKYELGNLKNAIKHPLATGGIGGFGGFLDIEFRKHDFFLGRKNAKNFLRGIFFLEYNSNDKNNLFYGISQEMIDKFGKTVDGLTYMPIIPDVNILDSNDDGNPTRYEIQDIPKFDSKAFKKLEKPIQNRLRVILKKELGTNLSGWLWWLFGGIVINKISKKITKWVINTIQEDFEKRGM
ncbi:MAG: patatin-like phospholipase family protein [Flavobacteriaceae bacterium]